MFRKLTKYILMPVVCAAAVLSGAEVASVDFVQDGKDPIPTDLLMVSLRLRPGMEFNTAYMDEDLKNLYCTLFARRRELRFA